MENYERLLREVSRRGPGYRWTATMVTSLASMKGTLDMFLMTLSLTPVPHHCSTLIIDNVSTTWTSAMTNLSANELINITDYQCESPKLQTLPDGSLQLLNETIECNDWTFLDSHQSLLTEFQLVCDRSHLPSRFMTLYLVVVCASMILLPLGDLIGRKILFVGAAYFDLLMNLGFVLSNDFVTATVTHTLMALGRPAAFMGVALVMENVSEEHRSSHGNMTWVLYGFGYLLSAPIAYFLPHWKQQFGLALGICAVGYAAFPFIPESPRWLLTRRRVRDAERHLRRICRLSHSLKLLDDFNVGSCVPHKREASESACNFRYLVSLLLLSVSFFTLALVYAALSLKSDFTTNNPYLNVFIQGCLELPICPFCWWVADKFGRRVTTMVSLAACGVGLLLMPLMPYSPNATFQAVNGLAIFVKCSVSVAFSVSFVHSIEMLPTSLKAVSFFFNIIATRIGVMVVPKLALLMTTLNPNLPLFVYGSVCILASSVYLMLPETRGSAIPSTVADMRDVRCRINCSSRGSVTGDRQTEFEVDEISEFVKEKQQEVESSA